MAQKETEHLTQLLLGAALSKGLAVAAELRLADCIQPGEPRSARELAQSTRCDERSLYRLLRFLSSHGIFHENRRGEFDHTPLSLALREDAEGSFQAGAQMFNRIFAAWDGLEHAVRTGEPGFAQVFGQPVFDYLGQHPELAAIFDAGMTSLNRYETDAMLEAYDFGAVRVLADIGGGNGSLLAGVLRRYPQMRGILFDLGHVVQRAAGRLHSAGIHDRCQVIQGNFFERLPAGADTYLFRHIIHDWTDAQCVQILGHCRQVIPRDGVLLVVDCVVPGGNGRSIAKDFDITMMTFPGGLERTEPEFRALFEQAGFDLTSVTPTSSAVSVVEGKPVPKR